MSWRQNNAMSQARAEAIRRMIQKSMPIARQQEPAKPSPLRQQTPTAPTMPIPGFSSSSTPSAPTAPAPSTGYKYVPPPEEMPSTPPNENESMFGSPDTNCPTCKKKRLNNAL